MPESRCDRAPRPPRLRQRPLATRSSARCAGAPRAATSGPGARRCSRGRAADTGDRTAASTPRPTGRCARAGYTAVGEFHYLGLEEALAAPRRPRRPGSSSCSPRRATRAAGSHASARRRRPSTCARSRRCAATGARVGVAPHSVRACPADWLEEIGRYAASRGPAAARPRRRAAARDRGVPRRARRAADRAARPHRLPRPAHDGRPRHARGRRRARPPRRAGARVCLCPTTEANLGDGFAPVAALLERGIGICIGSDSNVRIDPLEELRELEGIAPARRRPPQRHLARHAALLRLGRGRRRARPGRPGRTSSVDSTHPSLRGVDAGRRARRTRLRLLAPTSSARLELPGPAVRDRRNCCDQNSCGRGTRARTPCPRARTRRRSPGRSTPRCPRRGRAGSICVPSCHSL